MYLDRFYVLRKHVPPLRTVCTLRFRVLVFERVKLDATKAALGVIEKDRNGSDKVDRELLRTLVQMFVDMGMESLKVYQTEFEAAFLRETETYYSRWASERVEQDTCPEYLK